MNPAGAAERVILASGNRRPRLHHHGRLSQADAVGQSSTSLRTNV